MDTTDTPTERQKDMPIGLPAVLEEMVTIRKDLKWSQEDLAFRSGVPRGTIAVIETGRVEPRRNNLRKIAAALGVDPHRWERMLDGKDPVSGDALDLTTLINVSPQDAKRAIRQWLLLPDGQRDRVSTVLLATIQAVQPEP